MDCQLTNKVVFIAGSSSGIGKAIARAFLLEQARVVITGQNIEKLHNIEKEFKKEFSEKNMMFLQGDFSQEEIIQQALNQVVVLWGSIDIVIANIGNGRGELGWLEKEVEWKRLLEANFFSAVRLATASIPFLKSKKNGAILFINSIAGIESMKAPLAYSSAKAALLSYFKNLSREVAALGIRANAIAPGNIIFQGGSWEKKLEAQKKETISYLEKEVPMNRFGNPEEIAAAAVFLCSEKASFITGACLVIDGGQTHSL